jgi:hypothetical protein
VAKSSISNSPSSIRMFGLFPFGQASPPNTAFRSSSSRGFRKSGLAFRYSSLRGFRDTLEFTALTAISFLSLFRNTMKVLPLPSPKVMLSLECYRYYGQTRLPCRPSEISSPYIHPLPSCMASSRASHVHCRMASPACRPCYPGSPSIGCGSFR